MSDRKRVAAAAVVWILNKKKKWKILEGKKQIGCGYEIEYRNETTKECTLSY